MTVKERIKAGLESDSPGSVQWRSLLETALFEIERLEAIVGSANAGQSFADIKQGLRIHRGLPPGTDFSAGTNPGDGVARMTASHPENTDGKADPDKA